MPPKETTLVSLRLTMDTSTVTALRSTSAICATLAFTAYNAPLVPTNVAASDTEMANDPMICWTASFGSSVVLGHVVVLCSVVVVVVLVVCVEEVVDEVVEVVEVEVVVVLVTRQGQNDREFEPTTRSHRSTPEPCQWH
jgi:hypothetical protein